MLDPIASNFSIFLNYKIKEVLKIVNVISINNGKSGKSLRVFYLTISEKKTKL